MKSVYKLLKDAIEVSCALACFTWRLVRRSGPGRIVIYYHGIKKKDVKKFDRQMRFLARNFDVASATKILSTEITSNTILSITFDDGFMSFYDYAIPVLCKYGLSASVFIPTGNLGRQPAWTIEFGCPDAEETVIDKTHIVELDRKGFEQLSHSVSHTALVQVDDAALERELAVSRHDLERICGHDVAAISYPYGLYDARVCAASVAAGYRLGFTTEPVSVDHSAGPMEIGRFAVSPSDSLFKFKLKASGAYEAVRYLRLIKRRIFRLRLRGEAKPH